MWQQLMLYEGDFLSIRERFMQKIIEIHPALTREKIEPLVAENLLSPFVVDLPFDVLRQAQEFVAAIFNLRESDEYREFLTLQAEALGIQDPGNKSICMSYDFHLSSDGNLKLIEINTNASFLALGDLMYKSAGQRAPITDFSAEEIKSNILEELSLSGKKNEKPRIAIIDEKPEEQRLFIEFLIFADLFKSWGWEVKILDFKEGLETFDFIYNRLTDFYFSSENSRILKKLFNSKKLCFSPNPYEYFLLADKGRMIDWSSDGFLEKMNLSANQVEIIHRNLPIAKNMIFANGDEIWAQRKNLFFKPQQAYGAKQSYRGAKISRKVFDEIIGNNFIAQEFIEAPELEFETPAGPQKFKYDLRFYAYKGRVQSVVARLYQGQVTNLKTAHGGFACVRFT